MADGEVSVKVAIRVRPQSAREVIDCCRVCTNFIPNEPQIVLGSDKAFTYDHVFALQSTQREIFKAIIEELVENCFEGINSTILAYGQTGSGKTYTMGTQFDALIKEEQKGLIPRAVDHLFNKIYELKSTAKENNEPPPEFKVSAQFMELYNEEILDLLSPSGENKNKKSNLKIHEDVNGEIYVDGMSSQDVKNTEEVLMCLEQGALCRTTASTNMNAVSSRSHALFALKMHQMRAVKKSEEGEEAPEGLPEFETLTAKLVFVDLAGSERLKRTGATGDRAKEGISINGGLLALGNVISALGDEKRKASHVPYRDSKLTRLLQDSLGGNSKTLMIACVSPSDRDFMETLNTLKYANRAKNIKNKIVVNQDKTSRMINMLREENMRLNQELMEYKMGQRTGEDGNYSDMFSEITMLRADNDKLRLRIKSLKESQDAKDETIAELRAKVVCSEMLSSGETDMTEMVQGYIKEIESLQTQLREKEAVAAYRSPQARALTPARSGMNNSGINLMNDSIDDVLREAKSDLEKTMAKRSKLEHLKDMEQTKVDDNKENILEEGEEEEEDEDEAEEMECENFIDLDDMETEDMNIPKDMDENKEVIDDDREETDEEANARDSNITDMEADLADLADEINMKQKLVEELEKSQKKILAMKMQYEEKLSVLQNQIQVTVEERDKVLLSLKDKGDNTKNREEIKTKSDHYAKKLKDMESEMKRLKSAQREHDQLVRKNKDAAKNLKTLQNEITLMKKNKVKLMRQLKEETAKSKKIELKKQQEIIKLQREKQKQVTQIKKLQMEQKSKDLVLKRKQEEIKMMKKQKNVMLNKKAHMLGKKSRTQRLVDQETPEERHSRRLSSQYSSFSARQKWNQIEKRISRNILRKHTVSQMEAEMDRLVKDRERLEKDLDTFIKRKDKLLKDENPNQYEVQDLDENIEGLSMQVEYLQENINEHQTAIVEMMEGRECGDTIELQDVIESCSLSDCKYLLEHFLTFTTTKGLAAAQSNTKVKESEAQVKSLKQALEEVEKRLNLEKMEQFNREKREEDVISPEEMTAFSHVAQIPPTPGGNNTPLTNASILATPGRKKFFPQPLSASPVAETVLEKRRTLTPNDLNHPLSISPLTGSVSSLNEVEVQFPAHKMKNDPLSNGSGSASSSPGTDRRETLRRRIGTPTGSTGTPENVFERLHSQTDDPPPEGAIVSVDEKCHDDKIQCISVVKGHAHSVLSVSVHGKVMVTGSSDKTLRIWDLEQNTEVQRAAFTEDQVKKVVFSNKESVVYALTSQSLKAWDIRTDPKTCRSAPLTEFPSALLYPEDSDFIYYSTGISVRSWNIGSWTLAGVLHGHSGHVMCLEHVTLDKKKYIITGSRDHFCKIYDATDGIVSSRVPAATLNPPHFDGIEAIVWAGEHLYSGSRDMTIKKWHLKSRKEKGAQRPAHKDRVQALSYVSSRGYLASASRDGTLRLWDEENFITKSDKSKALICELTAHRDAPVYDIKYHNDLLFTASGDTTVKVWSIK